MRLWDVRTNICQGCLTVPGQPTATIDQQGLVFAVATESGIVKLYDLRSYDKGPFDTFAVRGRGREETERACKQAPTHCNPLAWRHSSIGPAAEFVTAAPYPEYAVPPPPCAAQPPNPAPRHRRPALPPTAPPLDIRHYPFVPPSRYVLLTWCHHRNPPSPPLPPAQVEDERNSPSGFSDIRFSNNGNVLMGVVEGRIYLLDAYKVGTRGGGVGVFGSFEVREEGRGGGCRTAGRQTGKGGRGRAGHEWASSANWATTLNQTPQRVCWTRTRCGGGGGGDGADRPLGTEAAVGSWGQCRHRHGHLWVWNGAGAGWGATTCGATARWGSGLLLGRTGGRRAIARVGARA